MLATRFNPYDRSKSRYVTSPRAPLSHDLMRRYVPSVFAEGAHESRSKRYTYLPTIEIVNGLAKEGFHATYAIEATTRVEGKEGFTKHMLRFRHARDFERSDAKEANEIILINSHDGSSAYQMLGGCFRFVCANGLVVGDKLGEVRVRHSGNVQHEIVAGAMGMMDRFEVIDVSRERMQALQLSSGEQTAFARAALAVRYDDPEKPAPIEPEQVLQARRWDDRGADLWSTFNRVQENLTQGGIRGRNANNRRTSTRQINGIDQNVGINRALWTLAEEMERLKAG